MSIGYAGAVNQRAGNRESGFRSQRLVRGNELTERYEVKPPNEIAIKLSIGEEIAMGYLGEGWISLTQYLQAERGAELYWVLEKEIGASRLHRLRYRFPRPCRRLATRQLAHQC